MLAEGASSANSRSPGHERGPNHSRSQALFAADSRSYDYEKAVEKARLREISLMNKMLLNEKMKNERYEQLETQKESSERRTASASRKQQRELRRAQEERMRLELQRCSDLQCEERRLRLETQNELRARVAQREEEDRKQQHEKEERRQREAEKRERRRKEWDEKAGEFQRRGLAQQDSKAERMARRLRLREDLIRMQREGAGKRVREKDEQFEMVKQRVRASLEAEEWRRREDFLLRKEHEDQLELRARQQKLTQLETLKQKAGFAP